MSQQVADMRPSLRPDRYQFVRPEDGAPANAIAMFREDQGWSALVPVNAVDADSQPSGPPDTASTFEMITLDSLSEAGLTAVVTQCLTEAGIGCHVVSTLHHENVLVPAGSGDRALELLVALSAQARSSASAASTEAEPQANVDEMAMAELNRLRASIDNLDAAVIHLLAERFKCTQKVGLLKAQHGMPASDPDRERAQIEQLHRLARESELDPIFAERFLNFVISEVIRHHRAAAADTKSQRASTADQVE